MIGSSLETSLLIFFAGFVVELFLGFVSPQIIKKSESEVEINYRFGMPAYLSTASITILASVIYFVVKTWPSIISHSEAKKIMLAILILLFLAAILIYACLGIAFLFSSAVYADYKESSYLRNEYEKEGKKVFDEREEKEKIKSEI